MTLYQICYWSDPAEQWVPVFGLPLYQAEETADNVVSILKLHPSNGSMYFYVSSKDIA